MDVQNGIDAQVAGLALTLTAILFLAVALLLAVEEGSRPCPGRHRRPAGGHHGFRRTQLRERAHPLPDRANRRGSSTCLAKRSASRRAGTIR